ncbi:SEC14-like protein 2 [Danio rerio]|uniref:SEC14-like lipid-binding 7 n=1 Tax=Danio rerio TaxID=7955 RepID=A0A0R4IAC3_DANRE|nr:SEC14-like protein 2 [Danio rerio]|eukprot:XP_009303977.1 SEC14-like protein 2 [Danio rerio]
MRFMNSALIYSAKMSGRVGDLSPKQAEALTQFREKLEDVWDQLSNQTDHYLLRWLRARTFNVPKAEAMLRKHLEFRRHMKLETIIDDWSPPEVLERYVAGGMCGYDREGSPIWFDIIGPLDPKGLLLSASKQDCLRTKIRDAELLRRECEKQSKKLGKHIESITIIYDCEGLGMKHLWKPAVEMYGEILTMYEENYPESLKKVLLIKAPKLFPIAYNLVKHFLREETRQKIAVLGSNWKDVLKNYVDADQIPAAYGGSLTDPDGNPLCTTMLRYGGVVPKSYYVRDSIKVQYEQNITISRGSAHQIEYELLFPNCLLRWQFASEGSDIGFGLFLKTKGSETKKVEDMQEILRNERYNAHLVPEEGSYTCEEPGIYVVRFDNSYSVLHSKKVSFTVDVLLPEGKQP